MLHVICGSQSLPLIDLSVSFISPDFRLEILLCEETSVLHSLITVASILDGHHLLVLKLELCNRNWVSIIGNTRVLLVDVVEFSNTKNFTIPKLNFTWWQNTSWFDIQLIENFLTSFVFRISGCFLLKFSKSWSLLRIKNFKTICRGLRLVYKWKTSSRFIYNFKARRLSLVVIEFGFLNLKTYFFLVKLLIAIIPRSFRLVFFIWFFLDLFHHRFNFL